MIKAYCDSSFDSQKGIAGIGILVEDGSKRRVFSNWITAKSNNEAELFAVYLADILTEGRGVIYTDSQTAIAYIMGNLKEKARSQEQYIRHKHCEYWAYKIKNRGVNPEKIKAHTKVFQTHLIGNRFADLAANEGRAKFYENTRAASSIPQKIHSSSRAH